MTKRITTKLTLYRRHAGSCQNKGELQGCECPIWMHGKVRGKFVQESLKTRSLAAAEIKRQARLNAKDDDPGPQGIHIVGSQPGAAITIEMAAADFIIAKNKKSTNSARLYRRAVLHFRAFCEAQGLTLMREITVGHVRAYFKEFAEEGGWAPTTAQGRLVHLRVWFNYCLKPSRRWIDFSPADESDLIQNRSTGVERVPFSHEEIARIIAAIELLPDAIRDVVRALIYLMLYTGMRISDATFFEREYLTPRNTANYYVIKNRRLIDLPPNCQRPLLDALAKLPASRVYYFQPDQDDNYARARVALREGREFGSLMPDYLTRINAATRLVTKAIALAGIKVTSSACHRFRDTFAINMLVGTEDGHADIYTVSKMLGHSDVKITDKHYAKLVPGYRERLSDMTHVLRYPLPLAG